MEKKEATQEKLTTVYGYDVYSGKKLVLSVNEMNIWCDSFGSPLADQTRYSRIVGSSRGSMKDAFMICSTAILLTAAFGYLIVIFSSYEQYRY